jgi:hypothetical protein
VRVSYYFAEDGYTEAGKKIPGIPLVHLIVKVGRKRARGPPTVDTPALTVAFIRAWR